MSDFARGFEDIALVNLDKGCDLRILGLVGLDPLGFSLHHKRLAGRKKTIECMVLGDMLVYGLSWDVDAYIGCLVDTSVIVPTDAR